MKRILFLIFILSCHSLYSNPWKKIDEYTHSPINGSVFPPAVYYLGIQKIDSLKFVACGDIGNDRYGWPFCRFTTDGGITWTTSIIDSSYTFYNQDSTKLLTYLPNYALNFSCRDTNFCIVTCDSGTYCISRDFLKTWSKYKINTPNPLHNCEFINQNTGGMVSWHDLYLTNDSGKNWISFNIYDSLIKNHSVQQFVITDDSIVYLLMGLWDSVYFEFQHSLWLSTDFGHVWSNIFNLSPGIVNEIRFFNRNEGWIAGYYNNLDEISYSSDGGKHWADRLDYFNNGLTNGINHIFMSDSLGIGLGVDIKLFYSTNHGQKWFFDSSYTHKNLDVPSSGCAFLNKSTVLITAARNGTIWKKDYSAIDAVENLDISNSGNIRLKSNIVQNLNNLTFDINALPDNSVEVDIYDLSGRQVDQDLVNITSDSQEVHFSSSRNVSAGSYFVYFLIKNQLVFSDKIIVKN